MSVKVAKHPVTGNVITQNLNNPEYGTLRVDSENKSFKNGFLNVSRRVAFIRGKMKDLEALGLRDGQELPGKIQMQESFEPFYDGQQPKINPSTKETILKNGREIYFQYEYSEDPNILDIWVGSTTVEVAENVQEALAEQAI